MTAAKKPVRRSTLGSIAPTRRAFKVKYWRYHTMHTAGRTFSTFKLADDWLADEQRLIDRDEWTPPAQRRGEAVAVARVSSLTFGEYSARWIGMRQVRGRPIKQRTASDYRRLRAHALGEFLEVPIVTITRAMATDWYHSMNPDTPTARAHAYSLFRSIMASAVDDGLIDKNPVHVRGASRRGSSPAVEIFTAEQVAELAEHMPDKHKATVLLAAWCGLRFGEVVALRRRDIELGDQSGVVHVRRGVAIVDGKQVIDTPKSEAAKRTVPIPPHIVPAIRAHLKAHAQWGQDGLLFPPTVPTTDYLTARQLYGNAPTYDKAGNVLRRGNGYYRARHMVGRDDLSFHKLRHFAATTYAVAGATIKELMEVLGHSEPGVAMRYQHAAQSRMSELAQRLSALAAAEGKETS